MASPMSEYDHETVNVDSSSPETFHPTDRIDSPPAINLPYELWLTILESPCTFSPDIFSGVMLNLVKNPNITSSHLFRADIFYDSENDRISTRDGQASHGLLKHLKQEYQPVTCALPGFDLVRTIVRQLVPRNPQLDRPLVQTCLFFSKLDGNEERSVVLYIPHVQHARDMPFYHPAVSRLAFEHIWVSSEPHELNTSSGSGSVSISYCLFPNTSLHTKLGRTALRLLQTVHKHGQGQLNGYEKRVNLDQVIPQKRYQDTYTRLKAKYGKKLAEQWVEVTDPGKHVFEDIGIAAFLIELWRDMYYVTEKNQSDAKELDIPKSPFPGFVDIGCGNGVLVSILLSEGYEGCGFDARERKTWSIFPQLIQDRLQQRLLIPDIFPDSDTVETNSLRQNGIFDPGTFIISNHADELTTWTPLLAYLNQSAFIAIPCCSHDLAGSRFRAPLSTKAAKGEIVRLPQQATVNETNCKDSQNGRGKQYAAETGSLKRTDAQGKMPSAYSTLCSYVMSLAAEVGFDPEKEVLRIPSTRNQCIIGRRTRDTSPADSVDTLDQRRNKVIKIIECELSKGVDAIGADWINKAQRLAKKPGSGH